MANTAITQVRRFNRVVTERVGALDDPFLARDRPLGEARLLWEIGDDGCAVRELRTRLQLDSGYVSRLLRSLETAGLVEVGPLSSDQRVRFARLTSAGRAERIELDRRSDRFAESLLTPLDERQRDRLVAAMAEVERLLTATLVTIEPTDPEHLDARYCFEQYFSELNARFDTGFEPSLSIPADADELRPPAGLLLVARLRGAPVGCAALKLHGSAPLADIKRLAEIKRMWVDRSARGLGLGRRLLKELETYARHHGVQTLRLETNQTLFEAVTLYRTSGYVEVPAFNDEPYAHHWFEKSIDVP